MDEEKELVCCLRQGLLLWQNFRAGARALYIGKEDSPLADALKLSGLKTECVLLKDSLDGDWLKNNNKKFDYIVSVSDVERAKDPAQYLSAWRRLLSENGKLLLGMNNRLGIRYFCGDRDPYTSRSFDGIENYQRVYANPEDDFLGRMYSRGEIEKLLSDAGWESPHFFTVLPDLDNPMLIYADGEEPLESLSTRLFPSYNHPDSVFLEEQFLYDTLSSEKLFHKMANSWLIECDANNNKSDVLHVTSSLERGKENGFFTIIHDGGGTRWVEKRAAYAEGERHLREIESNAEDLKRHGIKVVDGSLASGSYRMPFISAEVGQLRLRRLFREDTEAFLRELDHFRDLILQSSEHEKEDSGDGNGVILRRGYFDMVPLNSFYIDGEYVFYDQEFFVEHYPANVMLSRMVGLAYDPNAGRKSVDFPIERLYERYNLQKNLFEWHRMDWEFLSSFRKDKELRLYHEKYRADGNVINLNRQRMNFSEEEYNRLFMDIFPEDGRPLVLFGSGRWAKKFMILYGKHCNVEAVIDNNEKAWGGTMEGLPVESPETLLKRERNSFRVLICIKNYLSVLRQLSDMGVEDYRIFDGNKAYELPRSDTKNESKENGSDNKKKKYKVGYIAGVFDLFHIGHLNMFRRAKEQCEYLIVGVVSDEQVRKSKRVEPFVPFDERIEMVRSCRYVDEAHEIPFEYAGTREAWQMYHFDAQFSGSDYIDDNNWLAEKEFLHKHGAELVFFPYTEQTSSTKIKALIEKRLL